MSFPSCPLFCSRVKKEGDILSRVSREALESPVRDAEENATQRSAFPSLPTRTKEIFQVSLEPIKARMLVMEHIIPKSPRTLRAFWFFGKCRHRSFRTASSTGPSTDPATYFTSAAGILCGKCNGRQYARGRTLSLSLFARSTSSRNVRSRSSCRFRFNSLKVSGPRNSTA